MMDDNRASGASATGLPMNEAASASSPTVGIPDAVRPAWDKAARLLISTNSLAGEFASWAVQQSPYDVPDGLDQAIRDFRAAWPHEPDMAAFPCHYWNSHDELRAALEKVFEETPSIEAWNHRKNGRDGMGFSSRYDQPAPDDDFIDLWALSNNIARQAWKDGLEDKAFDDDFNDRWEAEHGVRPIGRDSDVSEAEKPQALSPEGVAARAEGIAQGDSA